MQTISHSGTFLALLPPVVAIVMAILTHRVLVSLGVGIIIGALIAADLNLSLTLNYVWALVLDLVWGDGAINTWNIFLIGFLLILGVFAALVTLAGGTRAFSEWAVQRIKTKRHAKLMTIALGIVIFIDDYFNCLTVGNISRPITDKHQISRANLAYIVDGTVAPVCAMAPLSSWGAYIIALIGGIFMVHASITYTPFTAFIQLIPMNFYAIFALLMVVAISITAWHIGPMKKHARWAQRGELYDVSKGEPMGAIVGLPEHEGGRVRDLLIPLLVLVLATVVSFVVIGYRVLVEQGESFSLIGSLEHTDPAVALLVGGIVGLLTVLGFMIPRKLPLRDYWASIRMGLKAMLPAVYILLFAWTIATVVSDLKTGQYLADQVINYSVNIGFLPVLLFIIAAFTAFSTGTSWGTFGLMLPIAADISVSTDLALLLPCMAGVLSGALWGDHSSPISDTTILSSTGAGCHHIDHVMTQLPYTFITMLVAVTGFLVLGFTLSVLASLIVAGLLFLVMLYVIRWLAK